VEECADGLELLDCLNRRPLHLVILDISMPHLGGLEATRLIKASHPRTKVLILTLHNRREYLSEAKAAGAEGYLLKDGMDKNLLPAIATLRQGGTYFSPSTTTEAPVPLAYLRTAALSRYRRARGWHRASSRAQCTTASGPGHCRKRRGGHR